MEFEDKDDSIYKKFILEFVLARTTLKMMQSASECESQWNIFLKHKDFGIYYKAYGIYEIIDQKKWLYAKLKYGI